ncbi:alpha-crystallin A chain-like [Contarinia nasturtii]|uniref:alpha-crystallin A chain-like n=1 Tax=Contarinia nasturtii TaxID=265458 RepID=UPI0012D42371|nr:alpha-crystallin A chain-like [Contarinia nasturtii]
MSKTNEPYFFEKYFPSSYHLTFHAPIQRYPGPLGYNREELEQKSKISKDEFRVFLDVKDFTPEDLSVKTIDETVIIEGRQKKAYGRLPSTFHRQFRLPEFFDSEDVIARMSDDHILEIRAKPSTQKKFRHLEELKTMDNVNRVK